MIVDKLYDKIFKARNEKKENEFWKSFYKDKIILFNRKKITDLNNWKESRYYNQLKKFIKKSLKIDSFQGLRILELGSGSGLLSILMAKEGAHITLVDKSREAIEYENILLNELKNKHSFKGTFKLLNKDIFSLKLNLNNFDIVHNYGMIEHLRDDKVLDIIKTMKKYLKKRGFVIVGVPNYFCPDIVFLWKKYKKGTERYYSRFKLRKVFEKASLSEIKIRSSNSVFLFLPKFLIRLIGFLESFLGEKIGFGFLLIGFGRKK